jgi:hypothetical protein
MRPLFAPEVVFTGTPLYNLAAAITA